MSATATKFRKALTTNSTATAFTQKEPTTTEPSGDGIWDLQADSTAVGQGIMVPSYLQLVPYAVGAGTNDTFDMRVIGWNPTNDDTTIYIPQLLLDVTVTLGTATGNDGTAIVDSGLMPLSIAVNG